MCALPYLVFVVVEEGLDDVVVDDLGLPLEQPLLNVFRWQILSDSSHSARMIRKRNAPLKAKRIWFLAVSSFFFQYTPKRTVSRDGNDA